MRRRELPEQALALSIKLLAFAFPWEAAKPCFLATLHRAAGNAAITHRHESGGVVNIPMDIEFREGPNLRANRIGKLDEYNRNRGCFSLQSSD